MPSVPTGRADPDRSATKAGPAARDESGPAGRDLDALHRRLDPSPAVRQSTMQGPVEPDRAAARLATGLRSASRSISSSRKSSTGTEKSAPIALARGRPAGLRRVR